MNSLNWFGVVMFALAGGAGCGGVPGAILAGGLALLAAILATRKPDPRT